MAPRLLVQSGGTSIRGLSSKMSFKHQVVRGSAYMSLRLAAGTGIGLIGITPDAIYRPGELRDLRHRARHSGLLHHHD